MSMPALTVNKVCLSGLDAIALADQLIRAGEFDIVVAGGMESMTNAPHLLMGSRPGYKYGDVTMIDHMALDGLTDAYEGISMGESTDQHNAKRGITRTEQDAFGAAEPPAGRGRAEERRVRRGDRSGDDPAAQGRRRSWSNEDEGVRGDTTVDVLAKLRPAFAPDGTITAGTSSPISDGACAVVVMSKAKAEELGLTWLAEIGAHGNVAGPDNSLHSQPANAILHALQEAGPERRRPRPDRDQRGVRLGRHPVHEGPRGEPGDRQRQRRSDRAWSPDRDVRRPARAHARTRAAPSRRRHGRRGALRRRRPGRRLDHQGTFGSMTFSGTAGGAASNGSGTRRSRRCARAGRPGPRG